MSAGFGQGQVLWQDAFAYADGPLPTVSGGVWELGPWGSDPTGVVTGGRFASGQGDAVTGNDVTIQGFSVAAAPPGGAIAPAAGEGLDFIWRGVLHPSTANHLCGYLLVTRRSPTGYMWRLAGGAGGHTLTLRPIVGGAEQAVLVTAGVSWPSGGGDIGVRVTPGGDLVVHVDTGAGWQQVGSGVSQTGGAATYPTGLVGVESRLAVGRVDGIEVRTTQETAAPTPSGPPPSTRLHGWLQAMATPEPVVNTRPDAGIGLAASGVATTQGGAAPTAAGVGVVRLDATGVASLAGTTITRGTATIEVDAGGVGQLSGVVQEMGTATIRVDATGDGRVTGSDGLPWVVQPRRGLRPLDGRVPHLRLPLRLTGMALASVEQDTLQDVHQCVDVVRRTLPGERLLAPMVGVEDPTFIGGDPAAIRGVLEEWEPRARVSVTKTPDPSGVHETIEITVALRGA